MSSELSEADKLRAIIHTAHDHLHNGRPDAAHEALHCGVNDHPEEELPSPIPLESAANIQGFMEEFNAAAKRRRLMACTVIFVPTIEKPGVTSVQLGGHVIAIQHLRQMLGKGPTLTPGDHSNRDGSTNGRSRNSVCCCGSGKKFKRCCGRG